MGGTPDPTAVEHHGDPAGGQPALTVKDWRQKRIHSTLDGLRLSGTVAALLVLIGLATVATDTTAGANSDAGRAVKSLPNALIQIVDVAGSIAVLAILLGLIVRALVRGQLRLLAESLLSGALCVGIVAAVNFGMSHATDTALYHALVLQGRQDLSRPLDAFLAALLTFVTMAEIGGDQRWWRAVCAAVAVYALSLFAVGLASLLSLLISGLVGVVIGLALRYFLGVVNTRPDATRIAAEFARNGLILTSIERVDLPPRTARNYRGVDTNGRRVQIVVLDRDKAAGGWLYRAYRSLRLQADAVSEPTLSLERAAERRVLLAIAARDAGAALPAYLASANCGPDTVVIAYAEICATPLADLPSPPTKRQLLAMWKSAEKLHGAGICHRHLTARRILVDEHGDVLLPPLEDGSALATELRITVDRAQLLATSAEVCGAAAALDAARAALTEQELAAALAALQPVVLSRETRAWFRRHKNALADLRAAVGELEHVEPPTPYQLERVRPRTVLMLAGAVVAVWLLVGQLGQVDLRSILASADWRWVPLLLLASVLTYFASAVALLAYVRERLHYLRTVLSQLAAAFVGFVLPPTIGGLGLNVRYLNVQGLSMAAAGTSVAANQIGNAVFHIVLLTVVLAVTGSSADEHSPIPGWVYLVVAGLALLLVIALAIPASRRWLVARSMSAIQEALPRLIALVSNPRKLTQAFAGAVLLNGAYIAALFFAVQAFHGAIPLDAVAVVYLVGMAVGSAAPTPGGIGAVEAALSAGLASAGMPGSVALSAALLYRIATFWLPVPAGWLALRWLQYKKEI
ncbi:MAG TPA: lysylphosphatidylglycerol synthase transmembrane domain-containing protein [Jatrophihabitans sp.]|nr:lysylphosphatidylglycerol synthase transmembrane domain-containing protein [Jatrophihabitans sp.]